MKTKLLTLPVLLFVIHCSIIQAQEITTDTIYLGNCAVGMERSGDPSGPAPDVPNFSSYSWTCGGVHCIGRTLMSVDLSVLPSNIYIINARLSLYADPACSYLGYYGQPTYGTFNRGVVKRITSAWDPNTVTWYNKPTSTKLHQLKLNSSTSTSQDYPDQDVTKLVQDMIDNPSSSYGIILQMNDETNFYKSLIFASCLHPDEALRPKLIVTYGGAPQKDLAPEAVSFEVEVAPNPASHEITFDFMGANEDDKIQLSIFSVTGQLMQRETVVAGSTFVTNVAQLTPGMYYFDAVNAASNSRFEGKFVKQ